jgi:hypothetical protein
MLDDYIEKWVYNGEYPVGYYDFSNLGKKI